MATLMTSTFHPLFENLLTSNPIGQLLHVHLYVSVLQVLNNTLAIILYTPHTPCIYMCSYGNRYNACTHYASTGQGLPTVSTTPLSAAAMECQECQANLYDMLSFIIKHQGDVTAQTYTPTHTHTLPVPFHRWIVRTKQGQLLRKLVWCGHANMQSIACHKNIRSSRHGR